MKIRGFDLSTLVLVVLVLAPTLVVVDTQADDQGSIGSDAGFSPAAILLLRESFEDGLPSGWEIDHGVWEVGVPTAGPGVCAGGEQCAGTVLQDNYPDGVDSRMVTTSVNLPRVGSELEIQLRFWHRFGYSNDSGRVQVSVWDDASGGWSGWQVLGVMSGGFLRLVAHGREPDRVCRRARAPGVLPHG